MAKRCTGCNSIIENDEVKFCAKCGSSEFAPIEAAAPVQEAVQQTPVVEQPVETAQQAPAVEPVSAPAAAAASAPSMPAFDEITTKKKRKFGIGKIATAAVSVALAVVIAFNWYPIWAFLVKTFGPDKSYLHVVENHAVKNYASTLADYYESYLVDNIDDVKIEASVGLEISKDLKNLAKMYGADLNGFENTKIKLTLNNKNGRISEAIAASIGGQDILTTNVVFDLEDETAYIKIKELTDKVLFFNVSGIRADLEEFAGAQQVIKDALPDASTVEKLLEKYVKLAINEIKDVDVSSETVDVGDISEKLTTVEYNIDNDTVIRMIESIVKKAKSDKDIKKILNNFQSACEDADIDIDDDIYDEYLEGLEQIEDNIDDIDPLGDNTITIIDYVNGSHEIVGRKLDLGRKQYEYVTVMDGKNFETEVNLDDQVVINGSGTKKSGKKTGSYKLYVEGNFIGTLEVEDFMSKAFKKGEIKGTIRLIPSSDIIKQISREAGSIMSTVGDIALELDLDITKTSGSIAIKPLINGKKMLTLSVSISRSSSDGVSIPAGDKIDLENEDDLEELAESINFDKVIKNLRKTSIPDEYIDAIEEAFEKIESDPEGFVESFTRSRNNRALYDYEEDPFDY